MLWQAVISGAGNLCSLLGPGYALRMGLFLHLLSKIQTLYSLGTGTGVM